MRLGRLLFFDLSTITKIKSGLSYYFFIKYSFRFIAFMLYLNDKFFIINIIFILETKENYNSKFNKNLLKKFRIVNLKYI